MRIEWRNHPSARQDLEAISELCFYADNEYDAQLLPGIRDYIQRLPAFLRGQFETASPVFHGKAGGMLGESKIGGSDASDVGE